MTYWVSRFIGTFLFVAGYGWLIVIIVTMVTSSVKSNERATDRSQVVDIYFNFFIYLKVTGDLLLQIC